MFVPCTALLYDSIAVTQTIKLSTTLWSNSCAIRLIFFWWCTLLSVDCLQKLYLSGTVSENSQLGGLKWGGASSQDLNPPHYVLMGYLKDRVCENNPQTRENIITKEIRRLAQEMLNRVWTNLLFYLLLIQQRSPWNKHSINYLKSIVKRNWL